MEVEDTLKSMITFECSVSITYKGWISGTLSLAKRIPQAKYRY